MSAIRRRLPVLLALCGVLAAGALLLDLDLLGWLAGGPDPEGEGAAWQEVGRAEDGGPQAGESLGGPGLAGGGQPPRAERWASLPAADGGGSDGVIGPLGPGVRFEGTVLGVDGRPATEVPVRLLGAEGLLEFATGPDGRFERQVAPGRYALWVQGGAAGALLLPNLLVDGSAEAGREFRLQAPGELFIRVLRGNAGVAGVEVEVLPPGRPGVAPVEPRRALTDPAGEVRFGDLPQARYQIRAAIPDGPQLEHSAHAVPAAKPVVVRVPDAVALRGQVRAGAGGPGVGGALVRLKVRSRQSAGLLCVDFQSGGDGRFDVAVPQGDPVGIEVEAPGFAPWPTPREHGKVLRALRALRGAGPVELDVPLAPGAGVSGRVTHAGSERAVAGLTLLFRPRRGPLREALTDAGGRYVLEHLNPERYTVSVRDDPWYPAKDQPLVLEVPAGPPQAQTLDVRVERARRLAGVVLGSAGEPAHGARVWIVGGGRVVRSVRDAGRDLEAFTDAAGRWRIADLPPGSAVYVRAALGAAQARPVLVSGERAAVDDLVLRLEPTASVSGLATDLVTREPVPGARVEARPAQGDGRTGHWATCDAEGRYVIEGLLPGDWELRAMKPGFLEPVVETLTIRPGADDLRAGLRVDPGEVFAGRVVGADGRPLAGARVTLTGTDEQGKGLRAQRATTKADGLFRISGVPHRGLYQFRVDKPAHLPVVEGGLRYGSTSLHVVLVRRPR